MEMKTIQTQNNLRQKEIKNTYFEKNRAKLLANMAEYWLKNKDLLCKKRKEFYLVNKKEILERNRKWRENNREKYLESKRKEYYKNRSKYAENGKKYLNRKLKEDSYFKFVHSLRTRLRIAIKKRYKAGSAVRDLWCSWEEAYNYIQSLFIDGMSWDNYGEWHIDHKIPLSSFNLQDREQFTKAVHYTNLQPLWAIDNIKKNDRLN